MNTNDKKIALTMIVGGNYDIDKVINGVKSALPWVHGVFIALNGNETDYYLTQNTFYRQLIDGLPREPLLGLDDFDVRYFQWEDNFATMRNHNFSMVPREDYDFYLWLDSDDTIENGEGIQKSLMANLKQGESGLFCPYHYVTDLNTGRPIIKQRRERLLSTKTDWVWHFAIHEACHGRPGVFLGYTDLFYIRHWREIQHDEYTRTRNRRILKKEYEENPNEPRNLFYLANETFAEGDSRTDAQEKNSLARQAIAMYEKFIEISPWQDDTYMANHYMAECWRMIGQHNKAIDADIQGIKFYPTWPHSYCGVAQSIMFFEEWDKMEFWADLCINKTIEPVTAQAIDTNYRQWTPYLLRGIARGELGKTTLALEDLKQALSIDPTNERVLSLIDDINTKSKSKPNASEDWNVKRRQIRKKNKKPSIAIVTRPLFEHWHPSLLGKSGMGGAETCVMKLAPEMVKDGYRVVVFGTPSEDQAGLYKDGVEYYPSQAWAPEEPFDVLISSRAPEVFDANHKSKKTILWMHDVNVGPNAFVSGWGDLRDRISHFVCLSEWHKNHFGELEDIDLAKIIVAHNGVDLARYSGNGENRDKNKFVFSSSPDRGIDVVLDLWPHIKSVNPKATLHVFYGWNAIDRLIQNWRDSEGDTNKQRHFLENFKQMIIQRIEELGGEEGGIHWYNRIAQDDLAKAQEECFAWLYPTYFSETFCLTAIEMQAAGVIPVCSRLAALGETVGESGLFIDGYSKNTTYRARFMEAISWLYDQPDEVIEALQIAGKTFASNFTWENTYRNNWKPLLEA